jgi:hypothetical protein
VQKRRFVRHFATPKKKADGVEAAQQPDQTGKIAQLEQLLARLRGWPLAALKRGRCGRGGGAQAEGEHESRPDFLPVTCGGSRRAVRPLPKPPEQRPRLTLSEIVRVLKERNAAEVGGQEERAGGGGEAEQGAKPR